MPQTPPTKSDPAQLKLIQALLDIEWSHKEIMAGLKISRRTLFRRLRDLKRIRASASDSNT